MKPRVAVYPGSFDPVTNGHLDIIKRAARLFDSVIVAVSVNYSKTPTFVTKERLAMLKEACAEKKIGDCVKVEAFNGLLVDYLKTKKARAVIRGLRFISDFEYEFQMALLNRRLDPTIETVFLMPDEKYSFLSSSIVKEIASLKGKVHPFVPNCVAQALQKATKAIKATRASKVTE